MGQIAAECVRIVLGTHPSEKAWTKSGSETFALPVNFLHADDNQQPDQQAL